MIPALTRPEGSVHALGIVFLAPPRVLIKINGNLAWSSVGDLLILKRCITLGIYSVQCLS